MSMQPDEYREWRERLGSQDKAARALNVSVASIVKRESGKIRIRREAALAMMKAVEIEGKKPTRERLSVKPIQRRKR